jgi:threonine/homoserine/homoserine lactone efflux protein
MIADPTTLSAALLLKFALGYFAILATPGPNMFTIGTMAALRGFRGAVPFCLGVALGAGVVAATTSLLLDAFAGSENLEMGGRIVASILLIALAYRIICAPAQCLPKIMKSADAQIRIKWGAGLGSGFCIAVTNPVTAAYCLAQFMGPLAQNNAVPWAIAIVGLQALFFGLLTALLFAQPYMRQMASIYHRQVCTVSGLILLSLGLIMLIPVFKT